MNTIARAPNQTLQEKLDLVRGEAARVILDKRRELDLALACLIAGGHLLIEDIPGVGKTTMVKTLARLLSLNSSRIQFTNDLLPADILGSSIYDSERKVFVFHRGPIFAQLVVADELNRATPKTQSACLQAMEERRITVDGVTYELPEPFFVVATQNPREQIGTFPLPESQLDRFLMRLSLGFPSREAERDLLLGESRQELVESLRPVLAATELLELRRNSSQVHASQAIVGYIQDLVSATRGSLNEGGPGLSPRGALGLLGASRAWALINKRNIVLPEDVQAVAVAVMSHRLNPADDASGMTGVRLAEDVINSTRVD